MGRTAQGRHIHFHYSKSFAEMWEDQPQELKNTLEEYAKPYGYTGQNIFYSLVWLWTVNHLSGKEMKPFIRKPV